jgi:hypothetical protein
VANEAVGPYVALGGQPFVCQLDRGGSIDPSPTLGPDGRWWLTWKSDDNALGRPTHIWSSQLSADGLALIGPVHHLLSADHPREAAWGTLVIEGPDLVFTSGQWWLFYGGGQWDTTNYFIHYAWCAGPAGPCAKQGNPWVPWLDLTSGRYGTGGASLFLDTGGNWFVAFHGWIGAVGYPSGGRATHIEPVTFDGAASAPRLRPDLPRLLRAPGHHWDDLGGYALGSPTAV